MSLRAALGETELFGFGDVAGRSTRLATPKIGFVPGPDIPASTSTTAVLTGDGSGTVSDLNPTGDHDWFRVVLTQTENDFFYVGDEDDRTSSLALRDAQGNVLVQTSTSSGHLTYYGTEYDNYSVIRGHLSPGTYYVDVGSGSGSASNYYYVEYGNDTEDSDETQNVGGGPFYDGPATAPSVTFSETYIGSTDSVSIQGANGNDLLFGGGGSDTLYGGAGADSLGAGSDTAGAGTSANDQTYIFGLDGDDTIYGGNGHDHLFGQMGNDSIVAGAGSDSIYGGNDDDTIDTTHATGTSRDFISGDNGDDTITLGALGSHTVLGGMGDDTITLTGGDSGSVHAIFGNQGNDVITADSAGAMSVFGGQGDDTITVSGGTGDQDHYVFGNIGNDIINSSGGFETIFGGQGNDEITVVGSNDVIHGDLGNDTITLAGGAGGGGETVYGGAGGDFIFSGAGHATADYFVIGAGESTAQADSTTTNGSTTTTVDGRGNLDRIYNFVEGRDHVVLAGHSNLYTVGSSDHPQNVTVGSVTGTAQAGYEAAYDYAYGNSASGATSHFGAFEYVEVHTGDGTYVFTNDANHTAVLLRNVTTDLSQNDILAG